MLTIITEVLKRMDDKKKKILSLSCNVDTN